MTSFEQVCRDNMKTLSDLFKKHEVLIVIAVVIVVLTVNYSRLLDYLQQRAIVNETRSQVALQQQQKANSVLAATATEAAARYQSMIEQLTAANKALVANQQQRTVQVQAQQQTDRAMTPDQLAKRWTGLIGQDATSVIPDDKGYQVSSVMAVETVTALEVIPQLYDDLQDEKQIATNYDSERAAANTVNKALDDQLAGLKAEIIKQDAACKAEVAVVKAQVRKSKMRWFIVGVVVGAIARNLAGL